MFKNIIIVALVLAFGLQSYVVYRMFNTVEIIDRANTYLYLGNVRLFNYCTKGR